MSWVYCSFADDTHFCGGCFVEVAKLDVVEAALRAHELGINPGGEVIACPVDEKDLPGQEWRNRLLSKKDLEFICGGPGSLLSLQELMDKPD